MDSTLSNNKMPQCYYKCERCFYITKQKIEIRRHINRKFKCTKDINSKNIDDNQLYELSLKKHIINENESFEDLKSKKVQNIPFGLVPKIELLKFEDCTGIQNDTVEKYNKDLNENKKDEYKNKIIEETFYCKDCDLFFHNKSNLNRHLKKNSCTKNNNNTTNITHSNTTINHNTTFNQQNIININLKLVKPFDDDWDVSNIDYFKKALLVLSNYKYTKTLEHILENETNLNVIIENEKNQGIVYKNDTEKFIPMTMQDIVDKSMEKLNKHLHLFHDEIDSNNKYFIDQENLDMEKQNIDEKLNEYKNDKNIQLSVQEYIAKMYNSKKNDTLKVCEDLFDENNRKLINGF
jgi:hypothetical protein